MSSPLLANLADRVLVADGAMGTMLQAANPTIEDFLGHEGCNEILNVTRPEVVAGVHDAYFEAGADCVTTNSFGANYGNLNDYGIADRVRELARASATIAHGRASAWSSEQRPRFALGSLGPGTKLPTLGHAPYSTLRDAYQESAIGLLEGGVDALLVETCQDLLQARAAIVGARRAMAVTGVEAALICSVTVETTGTMLLGSEIGAALNAMEALGVDLIGLNCATGPAEMFEHVRYLSEHARVGVSVMPNAGLPLLGPTGATYPLTPGELADAHERFVREYGVNLVGGCCGTTPAHIAAVVERVGGAVAPVRTPTPEAGVSSLYHFVPFAQESSVLMVGERTNSNGSKAFREAMLAADWEACLELARAQARDGSHLLDVCVDYVGRDGVQDMRQVVSRFATASTLPIMIDSTEPSVIEAGLESLGGRCVVNSVNFEDGDGPDSRYARIMSLVREHGAAVVALTIDEEGQARTRERKVEVAARLVEDLTGRWGMARQDILLDCLTFPIATGQEETRKDGIETIEAIREISQRYPGVNFTLGVSNVSFGLNPAARQVLNSVFLHECQAAGLTSAITHVSKILPMARMAEDQQRVALDVIYDRRREDYDPVAALIELFAGVNLASARASLAEELAALPLRERLARRIVDAERSGLIDDLDEALAGGLSALSIINEILLDGMRVVGERFGSGQMQLPFVLQSAEIMKAAVAHLEPHLDRSGTGAGKGRVLLATVKGDVHDIGKNLVDIILSNNGYEVVNLGIKQPISAILEAAEESAVDVIGMSGLLVKSTVVMRENLAEMNARGVAGRWPVVLGGAALNRTFVESDLRSFYQGEVHYARDAFEGLDVVGRLMEAKRGESGRAVDADREAAVALRSARRSAKVAERAALPEVTDSSVRSEVDAKAEVPTPPFFGTRVVRGIPLADYAALLDERATFVGRWGLRGDDAVAEGRPRLRYWLDRLAAERVLEAAVVYGYFPCHSEGNDLVIVDEAGGDEVTRFSFPRQRSGQRLCVADYFRTREVGPDVVAMQLVTVGARVGEYASRLFEANAYRDYLEVHGVSVQLAEALAEYWHRRIRQELVFPDGRRVADDDSEDLSAILRVGYQGCRYSLGYSACPNLEDRTKIMTLLEPERIGVELTEEYLLVPEQATDAIVVHHPAATYFNAQ